MTSFGKLFRVLQLALALAFSSVLVFTGCQTTNEADLGELGKSAETSNKLRVGDKVAVVFSDVQTPIPSFEEQIRENGTITLHLNQVFTATDKTPGELQKEIQERYVPNIYRRLTVTVKTENRFFHVRGAVRNPGSQPYVGQITVTRAIANAGDFTDFANKKKVKLIRANGHIQTVNCIKALQIPSKDPPVYPGDTISVPQRGW